MLAAVLLSGCGWAATAEETNTTPLAVTDINTAPPSAGGEFRVAVDEFGSLNPMSAMSNAELAMVQQAFLPVFFRYDDRGVPLANPHYLVDVTETDDTVTLSLNPDAQWADGAKITAADVIATWEACNGSSSGFRCAPDLEFDRIESVTQGVDESKVVLQFATPTPQWRSLFDRVSVLRAASVADPEVFNEGWDKVPEEWTAGPYVVTGGGMADKVLLAGPNEDWWGDPDPQLARLTIREIPRENQVKAFTDAEIDVVDILGSAEFYDTVTQVRDTVVRTAGSPVSRHLVFNTASTGPVHEVAVRQAIAVALDRSGIGTQAWPDIGFTAAPLGNRVFLPGQEGFVDNADELGFTRNLAKARDLLNTAGWRDTDGVRFRDGRPLEVRLVQIQGLASSELEAAAIADQLTQIGVQVTVDDISLEDFDNGSVLAGGDFDMIVTGVESGRHGLSTLDDRFGAGAQQNWARFEDPAIDTLIEQIDTATDPGQQRVLAGELDRLLWEHMPTVPLYQLPQSIAVGLRVVGYGAPGLSSVVWENVGRTT